MRTGCYKLSVKTPSASGKNYNKLNISEFHTFILIMKNLLFFATAFCLQYTGLANNPSQGFIENKGQIHDQYGKPNPDAKFLLHISGMNVVLRSNGFSYDTYKYELGDKGNEEAINLKSKKVTTRIDFHRVDIDFLGANTNPQMILEEESKDHLNFYGAGLGENGVTKVRAYAKITYKNIYPNIDIEFVNSAIKNKPLEYNFILHPGANINLIQLKYSGANAVEVVKGALSIKVSHGTMKETIPSSFWKRSGKTENINFSVSSIGNNEVVVVIKV